MGYFPQLDLNQYVFQHFILNETRLPFRHEFFILYIPIIYTLLG